MTYRVVLRERSGPAGNADPDEFPSFLDRELPPGTVLSSAFLGRNEPEVQHSSDLLHEDHFLTLGTEIWHCEVAEGRDQEFKDALLNSGVAVEFALLQSGTYSG